MKSSPKTIDWEEYLKTSKAMTPHWMFRGQSKNDFLASGFERALNSYGIPLSDAPKIEEYMIRDFRRRYEGIDFDIVSQDTLYCLSVMQHYGCPTRLLDWTYSPYVAAFFAVENMSLSLERGAKRDAFVFCLNKEWINTSAKVNIDDDRLFNMRFEDKTTTDDSFVPLYMEKRHSFVVAENPHLLHKRLSTQKGLFLVQGNISVSMMENIYSMKDWDKEESTIVFRLKIDTWNELHKVYTDLRMMNISFESLFPGLDGFARSLKQNLYWYRDLPEIKARENPFNKAQDHI
jgi:hypothetical protein